MDFSSGYNDFTDGLDPNFTARLPTATGGTASSPTRLSSSPSHKTHKQMRYSDRFIPSRTGSDVTTQFYLHTQPDSEDSSDSFRLPYSRLLQNEMGFDMPPLSASNMSEDSSSASTSPTRSSPISIPSAHRHTNMLRFMAPPPTTTTAEATFSLSPMSPTGQNYISAQSRSTHRKIPSRPFTILEAPGIIEDFYLNILDWSTHNQVAVGLNTAVYVYSVSGGQVLKFMDAPVGEAVTAVSWHSGGNLLSIGLSSGEIQVWDAAKHVRVRVFPEDRENRSGHRGRVGTIAWQGTGQYTTEQFTSGSRDRTILHHDLRDQNDVVYKFGTHKQEVCGLRWSPDGTRLASGGNDNRVNIWNPARPRSAELHLTEHQAAVKALAWSPHSRGTLVSGGGTADRTLRIWNVLSGNGSSQVAVDTGSQICNVVWSKNSNEIASTHGYSQNHIALWSYPFASPVYAHSAPSAHAPDARVGVPPIATLTGHTMRVLYLAMSPDGQNIVTGAGDESLRFWNVFPPSKTDWSDGASHLSRKSKIEIR